MPVAYVGVARTQQRTQHRRKPRPQRGWPFPPEYNRDRETDTDTLFACLATTEKNTHAYRQAREKLILAHAPMVRQAAHRYSRQGIDTDDLVQMATLGLIKAVDRYDPTRGAFDAFARPYIHGEIKRYFRDAAWSAHVPRGMQELVRAVGHTRADLASTLGREPTRAEVARHLGHAEHVIHQALIAANAYEARPLEHLTPASTHTHSPTRPTQLAYTEPGYETTDNHNLLTSLLQHLADDERHLLELRFIHEMTQQQIGTRLGISQAQVSRQLTRCLTHLHHHAHHI